MELMSSGPPEGVCIPDDAMVDVGGGADVVRDENGAAILAMCCFVGCCFVGGD